VPLFFESAEVRRVSLTHLEPRRASTVKDAHPANIPLWRKDKSFTPND
jgi:hypothetical protein